MLDDPEHGEVSYNSTSALSLNSTAVGSIATYMCSEGYNLTEGSETRLCQSNGSWSGTAAICSGMQMFIKLDSAMVSGGGVL